MLAAMDSHFIIIIIIIIHRLTRHVSVIRMTNHRRGGHVDLRAAVSVIKRFEFLFESVCNDVQVASDDVRQTVPDVWSTVGEAALSETGSHPRNFEQVVTGGPELS